MSNKIDFFYQKFYNNIAKNNGGAIYITDNC